MDVACLNFKLLCWIFEKLKKGEKGNQALVFQKYLYKALSWGTFHFTGPIFPFHPFSF